MQAYVLVQSYSRPQAIASSLRGIPEVVSAEDLAGPYDAIALIDTPTRQHFEDALAGIAQLPGVDRVLTAPLPPRAENQAA